MECLPLHFDGDYWWHGGEISDSVAKYERPNYQIDCVSEIIEFWKKKHKQYISDVIDVSADFYYTPCKSIQALKLYKNTSNFKLPKNMLQFDNNVASVNAARDVLGR